MRKSGVASKRILVGRTASNDGILDTVAAEGKIEVSVSTFDKEII